MMFIVHIDFVIDMPQLHQTCFVRLLKILAGSNLFAGDGKI